MELSIVNKFFEGEIDCAHFKKLYKNEFDVFTKNKKITGSSLPINVKDDIDLIFQRKHLLKLYNLFLKEELNSIEIQYIADCLLLSETVSYENDDIFDQVNLLSDQDVNGKLTRNEILKILRG